MYSIDLLDCRTDDIRTTWKDKKPKWQQCIIDLVEYVLGPNSIVKHLLKNSHKWPMEEEELQHYVRRMVGHEIQDEYIQNTAKELFLLKKSLHNADSLDVINNAINFIAHCSKINLIPPSKPISYLNRALIAVEKLHNYSQTHDNSAIDIWRELVILCGCISDEWRKSPLWYASEALFQFERHPSIENAINIFVRGLYHAAVKYNCITFIDQFRSIACFNRDDHKGKLKIIFDELGWPSDQIIGAQNVYDFLKSLEQVKYFDIANVAKSILSLWSHYKDESSLTSISARFRAVFFNIIDTVKNEGHQIPVKDLKQLIDAISLYAYEHNSQLFNAIHSGTLILSVMNLHQNLSQDQNEHLLSSKAFQICDKPTLFRESSIPFDRSKLLKYKSSLSFENEYDNSNQWFTHMIGHDEVQITAVESISTKSTSSIDENSSGSFDSSGYIKRYENIRKDADQVSKTLDEIILNFPTPSTNTSLTEEHLLDSIVRLSQIVSNWSRSFTNICSLIRNDKQINDNNNSLAFQIIVDGINLLRYLLGLETEFAIFVNDPLSQFIQGQMNTLKNKLSSIPIQMLSEEFQSQFQYLRIFKQKSNDDDDDDSMLVLEGNINKKTDEKNRKSDIDHDDPFAHLKHREQEKILERTRNVDERKQMVPLASLDSFFSNEPIEENILDNEVKTKTLELKFLQEAQLKNQNSLKNFGMKMTTTESNNDSSVIIHSHLSAHSQSHNNSTGISNMSHTNVDAQATVDRIAESNFASQTDLVSPLIPSKEKIREMLSDSNIYDIYQGGSYHEKQKNPMAVYNTELENLLNIPTQIWSYQKLAACESINSVIDEICAIVRDQLSDLFNKSSNSIVFEWVIMIDNSGSMSIYENFIREALIIILETFRKLECRLAVGRFGNRGASSQVILKPFDRPLTFRIGQMIFEGLSFCESSHIATGIEAIAGYVWGHSDQPSAANIKRIALVVTDALSKELREDKDQFTDTKKAFNFSLAMLHVRSANLGKKMENLENLLNKICDKLCISVDPFDPSVKSLSSSTSSLLVSAFRQIIKSMQDSSGDNKTTVPIKTIPIQSCQQKKNSDMWPVEKLTKVTTYEDALNTDGCGSIAKSLCFVNIPTNTLPYEDNAIDSLQQVNRRQEIDSNQNIRSDCMEEAQRQLENELRRMRIECQENIQKAKLIWQQAQIEQSRLINELANVIEDYVMPCNRFSRRRADFSGPLYLPGLVKAIATDFAYKRIGSSKTAGGKRQYSIIFAIDISMSMIGHLEHCAIESLLLLTSALVQCGIDNFGIILFGYDVRILKKLEQPWDEVTIYMLLQNFIISQIVGTNDAIAIEYALDMLLQEPASNIKKVFVLTDGYTTCGLRLTEALVRADSENVEVVGCQIGFERPCLHRFYRDWIIAAIPAVLCDAFRYKYRKDHDGPFPSLQDDNELLKKRSMLSTSDDPQKILDNFQREFSSIDNMLSTERDAHLVGGSGGGTMSLDVCFVIDVTGSMTPWLSGVKVQINAITDGITKRIEKDFPDMDFILRYAVVAYRDEDDKDKIQELKFENSYVLDGRLTADERKRKKKTYHDKQTKRVRDFLSRLITYGGKDEPEDVLGALDHAISLNWEAKAKFAVLVCDAPAHGRECNDTTDRFPNGLNNLTAKQIMEKLTEKNIDLMLCHLKQTATKKMAQTFLTHLRQFQPNRNNDELLCQIELYDSSVQEQRKPYHFIFVLDESRSMKGTKWADLTKAYNMCLEKRVEIAQQSTDDIVSIIQFDHNARIIYEQSALSDMIPQLDPMIGGGTEFSPALNKALEVLNKTANRHTPVLLFMSDGAGNGGLNEMTNIYRSYHSQGLHVHTVAFGKDADQQTLTKLAQAGGGKFHQSITGVDLANTFVQISTQLTAVDGLINEFAKKVSDAATTKLMLEFL